MPNKKTAGVIIGGVIAPIFFNTAQDSGALPLKADVTGMKTGDVIVIDTKKGVITDEKGNKVLSKFTIAPNTLADEFRAGGRIPLIIGRAVTDKARKALGLKPTTVFTLPDNPKPKAKQAFSLAQKMVGQACGVAGILPGTACEPKMTTVGSQDTTGPMTADELKELACLKFQAPMFMQSFCHTAAYPKPADVKMHKNLPGFITERGGVALKPGDGVIHSWLNRLLLPDTVGTGGDSHTRFPIGISFPAGSGLVAFAGAMGFMPLDMPESVLVRFKGKLNPGITLRDVVNAIPYWAIKQGLLTVPKKNKMNVFNGRILEMEGLPDLTVEQAFELTDAAAERSAAAGCIQLSEKSVATYLKSNVALMKKMIADGYQDAKTLQEPHQGGRSLAGEADPAQGRQGRRVRRGDRDRPGRDHGADPGLPERPGRRQAPLRGGRHADSGRLPRLLHDQHRPLPRRRRDLARAASSTRQSAPGSARRPAWIRQKLKDEALFSVYSAFGARIEIAGCSLCMGNQARVPDGVNMFSTSTRNFDDRMGDGAKVFLGSAELGAVTAMMGKLPTVPNSWRSTRRRSSRRRSRFTSICSLMRCRSTSKLYE